MSIQDEIDDHDQELQNALSNYREADAAHKQGNLMPEELKPGYYVAQMHGMRPGVVEFAGDHWRNANDNRMPDPRELGYTVRPLGGQTTVAGVTEDDAAELHRIAARLGDQNNRCTNEVAFHVQKRTRHAWQGDDQAHYDVVWVRDGEEWNKADFQAIAAAKERGDKRIELDGEDYDLDGFEPWCVEYGWETVQVNFTEEGAKSYLKANGHNLTRYGEPRIYGESFHRNREMMTLRRIIPLLAKLVPQPTTAETLAADHG